MNPMSLNSNTYVLSDVTTASQQVTLTPSDINTSRIIVDNTLGSTPVFIVGGESSTTAVFPTSATVPLNGAIVGGGTVQTFAKLTKHKYIAAIRESGTADVFIKVGSGE